jgi:hypothetical protein
MNEFVRLSDSEKSYGARNLLQCQLSTLNSIKRFREYEKLRKEELILKVDLKMKVEGALQSLANLARCLPKTDFIEEAVEEPNLFAPFTKEQEKKERTVEDELDDIRRKLEAMQ